MLKKDSKTSLQDVLIVEGLVNRHVITETTSLEKIGLCSRQSVLNVDRKLWYHLNRVVIDLFIAGIASEIEEIGTKYLVL